MGANAQTSVPAFTAGQVLTAAQMTQVNTGIPVFASSTERDAAFGGTGEKTLAEGQYAFLEDTNETQVYDGSTWGAVAGGKILQVVRATDAIDRLTSSNTFVDASISVTITPTSAASDVMLVWSYLGDDASAVRVLHTQISDSSNNAISGAENATTGPAGGIMQTIIGYDSPATTSATTYKGRFRSTTGTVYILNATNTAQLFAIEVGA